MNSREYKQSTKSRKIACIKSYIKFLLLEGFITINPLKEVRQPKNNQKIPKTLSSNRKEPLGSELATRIRKFLMVKK